MKVILLAPANNTHTIKWLDYYDKQGIEVINVSLESHKNIREIRNWTHVKQVYLRLPFKGKLAYPLTASQLKKIIKIEKPDILHAHYASSYGLIGSLVNFNPYIVSVWGSDIYLFPRQNFFAKKLMEYTLRKADKICATSIALKEETERYHSINEIILTPFGVDINVFKPQKHRNDDDNIITIGLVKGMDWKYGVEYLIRGFKELENLISVKDFEKLRLMIVGDGPYLQKYRKLVDSLEISQQVTFLGRVNHEDVVPILNTFDIFVVPSLIESFGVAALEAQACGIPVIATDVGGLPEVVVDGRTGFIVPKQDFKAIANKLVLLINDSKLRQEFGQNAITFIEDKYNWEDNAQIMLDLYNEVLFKERKHNTVYTNS